MSAAPRVECSLSHGGLERIAVPLLARTRRHDVGVAREDDDRPRIAAPRPEVVDVAKPHMLGAKARLAKQRREQRLTSNVVGCDRPPPDQLACQFEKVHEGTVRDARYFLFNILFFIYKMSFFGSGGASCGLAAVINS